MDKRALCAAVLACVVSFGCATPPGGPEPRTDGRMHRTSGDREDQTCRGAVCNISVTVTCTEGTGCFAEVDPKVLLVFKGGNPKIIHWKLKGESGYEFRDEKVNLPGSNFDCVQPGQHKMEINCRDLFNSSGVFEYTLNIIRSDNPSVTLPVDPWIVN